MCAAELEAAGGLNGPGTAAAQALSACLTPKVMNTMNASCQACADQLGLGGSGGGGGAGGAGGGN
jgi:hypothetical protein